MFEDVMAMAQTIGRSVARTFPGIDPEDLSSEAVVFYLENVGSLKDQSESYIYTALEGAAERYALKERYDYMISTSSYVYRPAEVRAILQEVYWNASTWDVPTAKDDRLSAHVSEGTVYVSVLDIQSAWQSLNSRHAAVLIRAYRDGETLSDDADRKALQRAVDALTRALNWRVNRTTDHEGPGSSRTVSSVAAQSMSGNDW